MKKFWFGIVITLVILFSEYVHAQDAVNATRARPTLTIIYGSTHIFLSDGGCTRTAIADDQTVRQYPYRGATCAAERRANRDNVLVDIDAGL